MQNYKSSSIKQITLHILSPKTEKCYFSIDSFKQIVSGTLLEIKNMISKCILIDEMLG